ncbi:MAG: permease prefix domain 2-containing transporter, partial [Cyclobacteriaceae bacterium]
MAKGRYAFILRILSFFCPPELYEGIEGDLIEGYESDERIYGKSRAHRRMWLGVFRFFRPEIIFRNKF